MASDEEDVLSDGEFDLSGFFESNLEEICRCENDTKAPAEKNDVIEDSRTSGKPEATGSAAEAGDSSRWRVALNTHKAGMQGLDKEHINRIIYEASKNSLYYQNEMKKEQVVEQRVAKQQEELSHITPSARKLARQHADKYIEHAESQRQLDRYVVHIDMDAFYAAVEILDQPDLANKPMAVGGMGMLSTSNYAARKFGVRAGMPGFIGKKLCPDLVLVKPHFERYREASAKVRSILADYDPDFEAVGLDESFLDVTEYVCHRSQSRQPCVRHAVKIPLPTKCSGVKKFVVGDVTGDMFVEDSSVADFAERSEHIDDDLEVVSSDAHPDSPQSFASPTENLPAGGCDRTHTAAEDPNRTSTVTFGNSLSEVLREMAFRIHQLTGLTASAGVAPNRRLAKICSDRNKPNGIYMLSGDKDTVLTFVQQLPIRKVNGIGKVSERLLKALDINTCGDLHDKRDLIWALHTQGTAQHYTDISLGIGSTSVSSAEDYQSKSISNERTFRELSRPEDLFAKCRELCESLAEDVEKEKMEGKTVTLKLKEVNFRVRSRAASLHVPVSSADALYAAASSSLRTELAASKEPLRLRLMGVRLSGLQRIEKKQQTSLTQFMHSKPATTAASAGKSETVSVLQVQEEELPEANASSSYESSSSPAKVNGTQSPSKSHEATSAYSATSGSASAAPGRLSPSAEPESMTGEQGIVETEQTASDIAQAGLQCPVCKRSFGSLDNRAFNEHVDDCLNRGTIRSLLSEQSQLHASGSACPSQHCSAPISSGQKSAKGHKRPPSGSSQQPRKKKPHSTPTLHSLWATSK